MTRKIPSHDDLRGSRRRLRFVLCRTLTVLLIGSPLLAATAAEQQDPRPLLHAHAHNDYRHRRPLLDALAHGFCNVEADIFLADGRLLVGHGRAELRPQRSLQKLYLEPLAARVAKNKGHVYRDNPQPNDPQPDDSEFTLLIDLKSSGPQTYAALDKLLQKYAHMLSSVEDGRLCKRAVRVVISGNRPFKAVAAQTTRYAGLDGRVADLESKMPDHLMPMISDRWSNQFTWRGQGPMPPKEREKLRRIVKKSHQANRRVRFWATPEKESVWQELLDAEVDLINTDRLDKLQSFLLKR